MKNNVYLAVTSFTMCLFWLMIYIIGKQLLAVYLASAFGLIFITIFLWTLLKALLIASVKSSEEINKLKDKGLVKKSSVKIS
jgi:ABC-type bacteriocin/lantibiotic exporter with double-glycine peptidase domain